MADLSLKIAVKLLTKNFHNGVNSLKGSIRSLQMQFLALSSALGAGTIGFTNLISRMRDTAKETAAVNVALKNVSGSTAAFAENQKWLLSVANKYGVQINTLTSGFTKFKAAADIANMSAEDQRKIFESVSRASVAYALSAEDQRGVFMALSQMMSKGKVMAEELRLQMAERLPVAIQAMAKAAGVSVDKLDAMMKQGKVLSSEVLPKFADALTRMTPNIDLDNLNKSLSELSNSFVRLVEAFDIEGKYKAIVDTLGGALSWVADRAKGTATALRWIFEGFASFKLFKIFSGFAAEAEKEISGAQALISNYGKKVQALNEKRKVLAAARVEYVKAKEAEEALAAEASEERKVKAANRTTNALRALTKKQNKFEQELSAAKAVRSKIDAETRAKAELASANMIQKGLYGIQVAAKRAGQFLKAAFSATLVTAFLTALYEVGRYLWKITAEARRIKKLADETRKELNAPLELSSQEQSVRANYDILANKSGKYTEAQRKGALSALNSALGTEYEWNEKISGQLDDINAKKERYIAYLQAQQKLERAQSKLTENTKLFDEWKGDNPDWESERNKRSIYLKHNSRGGSYYAAGDYTETAKAIQGFENGVAKAQKDVDDATAELSKYSSEFERSFNAESPVVGGGGAITDEGKSPLEKAQKEYSDSLAELDAELRAQLITERDYTRKKRDLIEKSYVDALGGGDAETLGSAWFASLSKEFGSFAHGDLRKRQEEVEDMLATYRDNLDKLNRQHASGTLSNDAYNDALRELATAFYREAGALDLSGLPELLVSRLNLARVQSVFDSRMSAEGYKPMERSHRTWEMSEADVIAEELAEQENYLDYLRNMAKTTAGDMTAEINAQMAKVDSLADALKLAEAKEAIEDLSKELGHMKWDATKNAVSNLDNIVSSVERVSEVMNDSDASGWERIMAIWDAMTSMVDGFMEMIEMIETMKEVTEKLTKAKEVEGNIEKMNSQNKIQNISSEMAASAAQTSQEVADAGTVIGAETGKAIATGTAQGAKSGWPQLLWAIPAALAAVMAGIAMIPKFAQGGVVGGNSKHGDKVLARLNSGEGVLTEKGMANLAGLAGAKASNINVTGRLKAHGRDLMVVLENEKRYQKRIG